MKRIIIVLSFAIVLCLGAAGPSESAPIVLDIWLDFYGGDTTLNQGNKDTDVQLDLGDTVMVDLNYSISDIDNPNIGLWKAGFKLTFDGSQLSASNYYEAGNWMPYNSGESGIFPPDTIQFRGQENNFLNPATGTIISFELTCTSMGITDILFSDWDITGPDWATDIISGGIIIDGDVPFGTLATVTNVVPIPGAVWLLSSGILGLAVLRRRRR